MMETLVEFSSVACGLPIINIDTDQIFPARFLQEPRVAPEGYRNFLMHDLRRLPNGELDPDFPLNFPGNSGAKIIVSRRNIGSGSSREAAVYTLVDSGVRCVIAPSHGDIFASNAVNNGLLPAKVSEEAAEELLELLRPGGISLEVDLESQEIRAGASTVPFDIDPVWRVRLLNGWDEIDITRRYSDQIEAWTAKDAIARPWARVEPNSP